MKKTTLVCAILATVLYYMHLPTSDAQAFSNGSKHLAGDVEPNITPDQPVEKSYKFGNLSTLFEKIYIIDLLFNLDYVTSDLDRVKKDSVSFQVPSLLQDGTLVYDIQQIEKQVIAASATWDKYKQGRYMAECFERRDENMMNFVMGSNSKNDSCHKSFPFCTGTSYNFPAGVNSGSAQSGASYGCLTTRPNPAWYHLRIGTGGNIIITMQSNPLKDIDFICWGPFTSPVAPCVGQLTSVKIVSCSYSPSSTEICNIPNAILGEYYILLITNYSNAACNINFSQTGGTGATDCTIVPPPISNNGPLCVGTTLQLSVQNPIAGSTYSWTGPNGWTSTLQNPSIPNINLSNAGSYTLIITLNNQTSTPISTNVQIGLPPNPLITGPNQACQQSMQTYSVQNPTLGSSWQWQAAGGQVVSGQGTGTVQVLWINASAGSLLVLETSFYCKDVHSPNFNVILKPQPIVTCAPNIDVCINSGAITLTGGIPAGGTYRGAGVSNGVFMPSAAGVGQHVITYTYADANTCVNTCTYTITVNALSAVTPPASFSLCLNTASVALSGGSPAGGTYIGVGVSTGTFSPSAAGAGTHTITYRTTDANTCINSAIFNITVNPLPTLTCPADLAFCVDATPAVLGGGLPLGGTFNGPGVNNGVFTPSVAGAGTHTITYGFTNANGCTNTCNFKITVNPLPTVTSPANRAVCFNGATLTLVGGLPGGGTYSGQGVSNGFFTPSLAGVGQHTITYIYTNNNGCRNSNTFIITVYALPVANAGSNLSIPHGTSTSITSSSATGSGNLTFLWAPQSAFVNANVLKPVTVNLYTTTTCTLTVTDGNGCSSSSQTIINITGPPLGVNPSAQKTVICRNDSTQLFANPSGGSGQYLSYQWSSEPSGFTSALPQPWVKPTITTKYLVRVWDGYNNSLAGSVIITVLPLPVINLIPDGYTPLQPNTIRTCVFDTITLDAGNPGSTYLWSNGATTQKIKVYTAGLVNEMQKRSVVVTNSQGCKSQAELTILFLFADCNTGIADVADRDGVKIFPNPGRHIVHVFFEVAGAYQQYALFDMQGSCVAKGNIPDGELLIRLDVSSFRTGLYIVRLFVKNRVISRKLIVQ